MFCMWPHWFKKKRKVFFTSSLEVARATRERLDCEIKELEGYEEIYCPYISRVDTEGRFDEYTSNYHNENLRYAIRERIRALQEELAKIKIFL